MEIIPLYVYIKSKDKQTKLITCIKTEINRWTN